MHYLQHIPFEGLGSIHDWAVEKGMSLSSTKLFSGEPLPHSLDGIDLLIIMGGWMSVHDEEEYPWLVDEKHFVRKAIDAGIPVLGVCLGAQLLAEVLGARVTVGEHKEIGWGDVTLGPDCPAPLRAALPQSFSGFHWHGEIFNLPDDAQRIGYSETCANQGFLWNNQVLALQFHLETTPELAASLVKECSSDLAPGEYVQSEKDILAHAALFSELNQHMHRLLDAFLELTDLPRLK
ncbi:type 1 glutamine amidotransferase [Verrucomicrobia bacterium]|nr:type 1 glutamine amidotransferase [Verrucomicrobiota bacterium]